MLRAFKRVVGWVIWVLVTGALMLIVPLVIFELMKGWR